MPRKTLAERRARRNRLSGILDKSGTKGPDDLMMDIMEALGDTEYVPDSVGAFYTFIYQAKTPELLYDEHPLVEIVDITRWGFKGFNITGIW